MFIFRYEQQASVTNQRRDQISSFHLRDTDSKGGCLTPYAGDKEEGERGGEQRERKTKTTGNSYYSFCPVQPCTKTGYNATQ